MPQGFLAPLSPGRDSGDGGLRPPAVTSGGRLDVVPLIEGTLNAGCFIFLAGCSAPLEQQTRTSEPHTRFAQEFSLKFKKVGARGQAPAMLLVLSIALDGS